jgi:putative ABC transport system permease protein
LSETVRSALHNLGANRTRGLLTMLGVIIGVFVVVLLLAVGNGFLGYIDDLDGNYGTNNVTIQPDRLITGGIDSGNLERSLSLDDAEALAQPGALPDALAVSPSAAGTALLHADGANFATTVIGVWPEYLTVGGYTLTSGSFISSDDVAGRSWVIVLGANAAQSLFPDSNPLGQTVWLNDHAMRVSGIMKAQVEILKGQDDQVYIPLSTALDRVFGGQPSPVDGSKSVDSIIIRATSTSTIAAVQQEATDLLNQRHQFAGTQGRFVVSSLLSALQQRDEILGAMNAFMVVVAGISLLVGGIGIMNIMLVSVTERTHEIGLRKAIGARSRDILNQFLVESTVISLVGAVIGLVAALLLVLLISLLWRPCPPSIPGTILAAMAALMTGLFFGVSPARRAARLQPIEALRAE